MGQDSYAVLKVGNKEKLRAAKGSRRVLMRKDAALIWMGLRFEDFNPEFSTGGWEVLERELGKKLLACHGDRRGIFVCTDIDVPSGKTYDEVIENMRGAGHWVPRERSQEQRAAAERARDDEAAWKESSRRFAAGSLPKSSPHYAFFEQKYLKLGLKVPGSGH